MPNNLTLTTARVKKEFRIHQTDWLNCERCPLHKERQNVCLVRGTLPCQVLFIGEAPGSSEDATGIPFIGPSGKLLDKLISDSFSSRKYTYAITNILGCVPWKDRATAEVRPPEKAEAKACSCRLTDIHTMAQQNVVILVGKTAEKFQPFGAGTSLLTIFHPAYLLRKGGDSPNNLDYKRTLLKLVSFLEENL